MSKRNPQGKFFLLHATVYPYDVLYCIGATNDEILNKLQGDYDMKLTTEDIDAIQKNLAGKSLKLTSGAFILSLTEEPKTPATIAVLSHEIRHISEMMMYRAGIRYVFGESDEAFAYLHEHLEEQALSATM